MNYVNILQISNVILKNPEGIDVIIILISI